MTTDDHDRLRDWAGAYTMGALDADDRREFEAHLRECRHCRAEVGQLAALPGLLAQIDRDALDDVPDARTAAAIERRARAEISSLITSRKRWRRVAAIAAAVLVALVAATAWPDRGPEQRDATVELAIGATTAESASIRAEAKGWGTELHAELGGLPERTAYQLWTVDNEGSWVVAATWGPTPTGGARVTGASSTALGDVHRIVVTSQDRADVIVEATVAG